MASSSPNIASQFIVAYYKCLIYSNSDIKKFYDEESIIWRQSMKTPNGVKLSEAADSISPEIPAGCDFKILSYQINEIPIKEQTYSIFVTGSMATSGETKVVSQSFVIQIKSDRCFIISDILHINPLSEVLPENVETVQIPPMKRSSSRDQKLKKKNDKFTYRT